MTGVSSRATSSEKNTAAATVRPNCLKYWPMIPPMKLTGMNTAMMVAEVAMTARPIWSAASSAAWKALLPMRLWRTMFSISTIASSTRTPETSDSASRLTWLSENPIHCMKRKVGMAASGMERRDQRGAYITQEQPYHQHREDGALDESAHGGVIVLLGIGDPCEGHVELDVGILLEDVSERFLHSIEHRDIRCV